MLPITTFAVITSGIIELGVEFLLYCAAFVILELYNYNFAQEQRLLKLFQLIVRDLFKMMIFANITFACLATSQ